MKVGKEWKMLSLILKKRTVISFCFCWGGTGTQHWGRKKKQYTGEDIFVAIELLLKQ